MTTELMKLAKAWRTAANRLDNYRSRPDSGFNSTAVDFEYEALAGVAAESMCAYVTRLQAQVDALAWALDGALDFASDALQNSAGGRHLLKQARAALAQAGR